MQVFPKSTQVIVLVGPFTDSAFTLVTSATLAAAASATLLKPDGTSVSITSYTWSHIAGGYYSLTIANTVMTDPGMYRVQISKAGTYIPVWEDLLVVSAGEYAAIDGSAPLALASALADTDTEVDGLVTSMATVVGYTSQIGTPADTLCDDVAAVKGVVDGIAAKTVNLPAIPAAQGDVTAVGSAVATVDTVVDAIKAKTDALPVDPASEGSVSDVSATVGGIDTKIGTPAVSVSADIATTAGSVVDVGTDVGDVKAVTDKLATAIEKNGSVYRFTTGGLEKAPAPLTSQEVRDAMKLSCTRPDENDLYSIDNYIEQLKERIGSEEGRTLFSTLGAPVHGSIAQDIAAGPADPPVTTITVQPVVSELTSGRMIPALQLSLFRGEDKTFILTVYDALGAPVDLTTGALKFVLETAVISPVEILHIDSPPVSGVDNNATSIVFTSVTSDIDAAVKYQWKLWIDDVVLQHGRFIVLASGGAPA